MSSSHMSDTSRIIFILQTYQPMDSPPLWYDSNVISLQGGMLVIWSSFNVLIISAMIHMGLMNLWATQVMAPPNHMAPDIYDDHLLEPSPD